MNMLHTNKQAIIYFPRCHSCNMFPLEGPRYHCQVCADFDFCQACFDKGQSHNHAFERIDDQGQPAVFVGSPRSRRRALRYGVLVSYTYILSTFYIYKYKILQ